MSLANIVCKKCLLLTRNSRHLVCRVLDWIFFPDLIESRLSDWLNRVIAANAEAQLRSVRVDFRLVWSKRSDDSRDKKYHSILSKIVNQTNEFVMNCLNWSKVFSCWLLQDKNDDADDDWMGAIWRSDTWNLSPFWFSDYLVWLECSE